MTESTTICQVCSELKSEFVLNNKRVCLDCDELLFDIEIECEEEKSTPAEIEIRPQLKVA